MDHDILQQNTATMSRGPWANGSEFEEVGVKVELKRNTIKTRIRSLTVYPYG